MCLVASSFLLMKGLLFVICLEEVVSGQWQDSELSSLGSCLDSQISSNCLSSTLKPFESSFFSSEKGTVLVSALGPLAVIQNVGEAKIVTWSRDQP